MIAVTIRIQGFAYGDVHITSDVARSAEPTAHDATAILAARVIAAALAREVVRLQPAGEAASPLHGRFGDAFQLLVDGLHHRIAAVDAEIDDELDRAREVANGIAREEGGRR